MDKPWLLTRETFNDMRGDETALLYLTVKRILRAQHLKTLEWLVAQPGDYIDRAWFLLTAIAQARKDLKDG